MKKTDNHIAEVIFWWVSTWAVISADVSDFYTYIMSGVEDVNRPIIGLIERGAEKVKSSCSEEKPEEDICQQDNPPISCLFREE